MRAEKERDEAKKEARVAQLVAKATGRCQSKGKG